MDNMDKKFINGMIGQATNARSFIVPESVQMSLTQLLKDCELRVEGVVFKGIDAIREYMWAQTDILFIFQSYFWQLQNKSIFLRNGHTRVY